eukprot:TRINITY_DN5611_c0_g2_i2.p1 TRINITY_DN5611_c0_g2~~TRINITY_DN5611_c0_g2_i2.p1  ORF type:complete len:245 (+),score=46.19 TRINITY_DN5611_c0_g2_i2:87-821(+)
MSTIGYLNQKDAIESDQELMGSGYGFSVDQLMELAGLSVAEAITIAYPPAPSDGPESSVLIYVGPGNNGGDGLVAARHLTLFGWRKVDICYPKRTDKPLFHNLVKQATGAGATVLDLVPDVKTIPHRYGVVVDALFGFSFKGDVRAPFDTILRDINTLTDATKIVSVDIPSGWDVEEGDVRGIGIQPHMLVSLTAPKLCAKKFRGRHFLGGRFVPPEFGRKYNLNLPPYPGVHQCVDITTHAAM